MSDASALAAQMHAHAIVMSRLEAIERVAASAELQRELLVSSVAAVEAQLGALSTYVGLPGPELDGLDLDPARQRVAALKVRLADLRQVAGGKEA